MTENPIAIREDIRLSDAQWDAIKDLFDCRRRRKHTIRDIIDAILFVFDNDTHWRMLPRTYAPWQTVYYYYDKWRKTGVWNRVMEVLPEELRVKMITASYVSPYPSVEVRTLRPHALPQRAQIHTVQIHRTPPTSDAETNETPSTPVTASVTPASYSWILRNFLDEESQPPHNRAA